MPMTQKYIFTLKNFNETSNMSILPIQFKCNHFWQETFWLFLTGTTF